MGALHLDAWLLLAIGSGLAGYALYFAGLRRRLVEPNRASWLIWGAATTVEAVTYAAVNPGSPQALVFLIAAAASLGIALALWRQARWNRPDPVEMLCMAASLVAMVLWLVFREAFWAHMLTVAMVPVSFWPTWRSVRADRARERSPAWGLWTIGDLATLIVAVRTGHEDTAEYGYVLVELGCHASVWLLVGLDTINPLRAFGRGGRLRLGDFDLGSGARALRIGETHLGKAVFAAADFAGGETILRFGGGRIAARRLPRRVEGHRDRYLQIAPDAYLGPSGAADDLVNHSCAPNAGVRFVADGIVLIAIRPITAGEEIAWDYATTVSDPGWEMPCRCGALACRGTIRAFDTLPNSARAWYLARDLVAPYLHDAPEPERRLDAV